MDNADDKDIIDLIRWLKREISILVKNFMMYSLNHNNELNYFIGYHAENVLCRRNIIVENQKKIGRGRRNGRERTSISEGNLSSDF